ncbi:MAG: hypothetical protein WA988_05415, partial [Candidatus Nanopelagicales bacterium]
MGPPLSAKAQHGMNSLCIDSDDRNRAIVGGPNLDRSTRVVATETCTQIRVPPFSVAVVLVAENVCQAGFSSA